MTVLLLVLLAQAAPDLPPGHPAPSGRPAPSADELVQRLDATAGLKDRDKPFEIAVSLGRLYLGQGRAADARVFLEQALRGAESARTLLVAQRKLAGTKPLPAVSTLGCERSVDHTLAVLTTKATELAAKKNAPGAVACLEVAWAPVMEAEVLLGEAQFSMGAGVDALSTFTRALETTEQNAEARYGRGAVTLDLMGDDLQALDRAQADLERFLKDAPASSHAPNAKRLLARVLAARSTGGLSHATITPELVAAATPPRPAGQPPVLTKEVMEAFQNAPRTPEMEANFAKLVADAEEHLAHARFQEALAAYKQVMPYQPENPRLRAGMAWTMVQLNRQPMATNVWNVAIQTPDAVVQLGDSLLAKGDAAGARGVWQRLKDTAPQSASMVEERLRSP